MIDCGSVLLLNGALDNQFEVSLIAIDCFFCGELTLIGPAEAMQIDLGCEQRLLGAY